MPSSTIDIQTADGVADAYLTRPDDDRAHPGVLLIIDALGLRPRIEEMADRIAGQGYVVLAPNAFYRGGRAPGVVPAVDPDDPDGRAKLMEVVRPLMAQLTTEAMVSDAEAVSRPARAGGSGAGGDRRLLHGRASWVADRRRLSRPGRGARQLPRRRAGHRRARQPAPLGRRHQGGAVLRARRRGPQHDPRADLRARADRSTRSVRGTARSCTGAPSTGTRCPTPPSTTRRPPSVTSPSCSRCSIARCERVPLAAWRCRGRRQPRAASRSAAKLRSSSATRSPRAPSEPQLWTVAISTAKPTEAISRGRGSRAGSTPSRAASPR